MFCRLLLPSLCLIFSSLVFQSAHGSEVEKFKQSFSKSVEKKLKEYDIPGGAYVIVKNNQIVALETFGHTDNAKSHPVNSETVFRLASVSKTFAATLTTMLAQEQRLDLSDPVTKYVPKFALAKQGAADKIQLKHLLSHSSGLMRNAYDNLLHENWSMEKVVSRFKHIDPICRPAKCYGYQNIAYGFLEPAIEASQGQSYEELLQQRVFSPLKMTNASVGIDVYKTQDNTAKPHILRKRIDTGKRDSQGRKINRYVWRTVKVSPDYYKVAPAAGVNASITDLAKWLVANLGHNPAVLPPELLTELTTPRIKTKRDLRRRHWRDLLTDAHYGYGWRIYQLKEFPVIYHGGWVAGFRADIGYSPTLDLGFAVLINAESSAISEISSKFWGQAGQLALIDVNKG
ncbi:serine hydrolase [Psychrobium sp. 1_MG-2023]|uniref:serine hydrolase domain-containing protein n=1 Tax=Psychrobium sp. 1_MG-2023 TaxID=3062624 RepID=UPI000C322C7A|nr:serine hydrolase domain-containing protein [Psychrobium sp. 1_MG-2023]MDP2561641.1 serine hydrolase domain-containing protein [Psychrobium sp. 1_MG-2023]PKF55658.1 serine hydrolase [Alteromonadales bacterium alter-6D02]